MVEKWSGMQPTFAYNPPGYLPHCCHGAEAIKHENVFIVVSPILEICMVFEFLQLPSPCFKSTYGLFALLTQFVRTTCHLTHCIFNALWYHCVAHQTLYVSTFLNNISC